MPPYDGDQDSAVNARQIEAFRAIMRYGTLTSAAQALDVSQPALSQLLLHAEDQLGFKLFQRLRGRLVPTPEAEQLLPEAERLHRDIEGFHRFAMDLRRGQAGSVRLACSAPPALSFVPRALQAFRQACPEVRLVSYVQSVDVLTEALGRGEADLGVAMSDRPRPSIRIETIGQSEIVCVMPVGHRLAARKSVAAADLQGERLVSYRADSLPGELLSRALALEGQRFLPQIEIDVSVIALSFVQQDIGIALVDGLIPWDGFGGLAVRPFRPRISVPVTVMTGTRKPLSVAQDKLRSLLREQFRAYAGSAAARGLVRSSAA
jgi:DNA-binding transcriptional LysR family regulator